MLKLAAAALILLCPVGAQAFTQCTAEQLAGPGAHVAEEGYNPIKIGKYVYAGFSMNNNVGVATSSDWGRTIGKPVIIVDGAGPDSGVRLAAGYANVYALWVKRRPNGQHAFFAASHNHAGIWDAAKDLGLKRRGSLMQISADGPNVHVIYLTNDGNVTIRNSGDGGRTLSSPIPIARANSEIVITSYGKDVYIAWGFNDGKSEAMFAASHDGGNTFTVQNLSADRPSGANEPILALDRASGRLSMVWRENIPIQGIYIQSLDGGMTWSVPLVIDAPTRQFMVADDGTYIWISYLKMMELNGQIDFEVYLTASTDGGKSFPPGQNLSGPTGIETLSGDGERPIPWVDAQSGAFRLTGETVDSVYAWNGNGGHVYQPVLVGQGRLASPAFNSVLLEGPNATVMYAHCS